MLTGPTKTHGRFPNPEIGNRRISIPKFGNGACFPWWQLTAAHARGRTTLATFCSLLILIGNAGTASAQATGKLNDTGITTCANATSNSVPCGFADGDTYGYPRQEAEYGRAAKESAGQSLGKTGASDGASKGFDFTKVRYDSPYTTLASGAALGTGTSWGCTKDNVTGLIWDMKVTTASNARLNTNTYNWKSSVAASNGGTSGVTGSATGTTCFASTCDTEAYIAYTNTLNICGESANDWRLPTRLELISIVDASKQGSGSATVDATYFPNIMADRYWTSDNVAGNPNEARTVNMMSGSDGTASKATKIYVILVRP